MDDISKQIWNEYHESLAKHIRQKINNPHDAEDILQDVFIKIYKNIHSIKDPSKIKSWIYQIANNTIIDYYRKRKDTPTEAEFLEKSSIEEDDSDNLNDEICQCLRTMISELPVTQQNAIKQYNLEGKTHKEISKEADISISGSKMRVQRGKENLKETLLDCCEFKFDAFGNVIDYKLKKGKCTRCNCTKCKFMQE